MFFITRTKSFVNHSLAFSLNKWKGSSLGEVVIFYLKKTKLKRSNGRPQKKKMQCLFRKNKGTNIYFIQFSIQFTSAVRQTKLLEGMTVLL